MKLNKIYTLTLALLGFFAFVLVPPQTFAEYTGKTSEAAPKDLGRIIVKFKKDLPEKDKEDLISRYKLKINFSIPGLDLEIFDVSGEDTGGEVADRLNAAEKGKTIEYAEADQQVTPDQKTTRDAQA